MKLTPHAFMTMFPHDMGPVVFDLGDEQQRQAFLDEILDGGHEWDDGDMTDDMEPLLIVKIIGMPPGYTKTLPEHGGW